MLLTISQKEKALDLIYSDGHETACEFLINNLISKECSEDFSNGFSKGFFKGVLAATEMTEHFLNTKAGNKESI